LQLYEKIQRKKNLVLPLHELLSRKSPKPQEKEGSGRTVPEMPEDSGAGKPDSTLS
jgi:hypothetical protein